MSLKNVKKNKFFSSIKSRLIFLYSLGVFFLLSTVCIFLYWQTINTLHKADYQFLDDEVENVQILLNARDQYSKSIKQAVMIDPIQSENSMYRYFIRIVDDKAGVISETPGMRNILPAYQLNNTSRKKYRWYSKNDVTYLLVQKSIFINPERKAYIQILLDVSSQHSFINDRKNLLLILLIAAISSIALGFIVANRGLYSLHVLAKTTENISIHSLDQRIDPASWPVELRGVAFAFNQMLARVQTGFDRLHQLSADLAHELRTPVTNLIGESEISLIKPLTIEQYQNVISSNLEELQRLSSLIDAMLYIARTENTRELHKETININAEIMAIVDYFHAAAEEKRITIVCNGDAELSVNLMMFRRIINNILSNALKFTNDNGHIAISIISYLDEIFIDISDTGVGIAAEHISKLFNRFYRVPADANQPKGHGLGLPIVKSIMDMHDGAISVTSEAGKGTCVRLTFPA